MNGTEEEEMDEQEGQVITAIREELRGTVLVVTRNMDFDNFPDIFSDSNIDSLVKLGKGNATITTVEFFIYDKEDNDTLWEKVGEGLANLESLKKFDVNFEDTADTTPRADLETLEIVLPYLRQELVFIAFKNEEVDPPFSQDEVKGLARVIHRHPTIKEFHTGCNFYADIIFFAMATLPSLEVAIFCSRIQRARTSNTQKL